MVIGEGIFIVSLDFELYWGVRDKRTIQEYQENLDGVENAIRRMLELFDKYEIHATWATVGFLFAHSLEELESFFPNKKPCYDNTNLSPFDYIAKKKSLEPRYHFSVNVVEEICRHRYQEVGSHTFSHYCCLENGQTADEFSCDIMSARKIAKARKIKLKSLVFPRNQWNEEYLSILADQGIVSYRGNEESWLYKAIDEPKQKLTRRALRLLDSYFNLTGTNSYSLSSIDRNTPYNLPASRFLRPVANRFSIFEGLRRRRIVRAIKHAAKKREVFHLWWHPHNFGADIDRNMYFLESILSFFSDMKKKQGMKSLNMGEVGELLAGE